MENILKTKYSGLVNYLVSGETGIEEAIDFATQTYDLFPGNSKFYLKEGWGFSVDFCRDSEGNNITKNHPYRDLSQAIILFQEGKDSKFPRKQFSNYSKLEELFKNKGKHFVAGYLSDHDAMFMDQKSEPSGIIPKVFRRINFFGKRQNNSLAHKVAENVWAELAN